MSNEHPTLGNGKVCYIEIPAIDIQTSATFYRNVFGWRIRERGDGNIAFDDGVGQVSGTWVTGRQPATKADLLVYIMVDDLAASVEAVKANGGTIVEPPGMHPTEIIARFADPAGNVFGLYQDPH
jgi:predicted enzyme related to lactoylglutathione lyase